MRFFMPLLAAALMSTVVVAGASSPAAADHLRCNAGQAWKPWPQYERHWRQMFGDPGHFSHLPERCALRGARSDRTNTHWPRTSWHGSHGHLRVDMR